MSYNFTDDNVQMAYNDLQNAQAFYENIHGDADEDLYLAANYNLKSAQHMLNYQLKQSKERRTNEEVNGEVKTEQGTKFRFHLLESMVKRL